MIQLITFLIAQLIFVPVYLLTTDICTGRNGKWIHKVILILISPFAAYLYINFFLGFISVVLPEETLDKILSASDLIVISLSFLFMAAYVFLCMRIDKWNKIYYSSIYLTFFLLQMAFNYTYVTIAGSILCNICVPLLVVFYYIKKVIPLYRNIKEKPSVKVSRSLFLLPAMAGLFLTYRSFVVIYLSYRYPEVSLNSISANIILTVFAYILVAFIFVGMVALLRNILNEQNIYIEMTKNSTLTTDMIKALVKTIDAKDPYTNGHSIRVAEYSKMIASQVYSDEKKLNNIYNIALLHDIGKIGIPDTIINKPSKLTDEEYRVIKEHPLTGAQILSEIKSVPDLIYGAKYHHERYDGKGYPCGIKGKDLPEIAAIIAVADAYDAMTSNRSYRKLLSQDIVRSEIEKGLGTQFHPKWGKIMLDLIDKDTEYKMHQ